MRVFVRFGRGRVSEGGCGRGVEKVEAEGRGGRGLVGAGKAVRSGLVEGTEMGVTGAEAGTGARSRVVTSGMGGRGWCAGAEAVGRTDESDTPRGPTVGLVANPDTRFIPIELGLEGPATDSLGLSFDEVGSENPPFPNNVEKRIESGESRPVVLPYLDIPLARKSGISRNVEEA